MEVGGDATPRDGELAVGVWTRSGVAKCGWPPDAEAGSVLTTLALPAPTPFSLAKLSNPSTTDSRILASLWISVTASGTDALPADVAQWPVQTIVFTPPDWPRTTDGTTDDR